MDTVLCWADAEFYTVLYVRDIPKFTRGITEGYTDFIKVDTEVYTGYYLNLCSVIPNYTGGDTEIYQNYTEIHPM
jgi:hypothetical protein